jgi:hypothetical protein
MMPNRIFLDEIVEVMGFSGPSPPLVLLVLIE